MRVHLLLLLLLAISAVSLGQTKKQKLTIAHLTGDFYIYTTFGDPGDGSLFPANGMYVLTNKGAILFDTPWDSTQFQPLLDSIKTRHHKNVLLCLSTHFHADRTAGLNYYKKRGIKTYTTKQTDELSAVRNEPRASHLIYKDTVFTIGQYKFEVYYPGKGHSPDNIVAWFGKEKILYGGCFIKSTDTNNVGNLSDANIDEWILSGKKVQAKFDTPNYIIPGHQSWTSKNSLSHTLEVLEKYKKDH